MQWKAKDVDLREINAGRKLTTSTNVTETLFNNLVNSLLFLKEVKYV